MTNLDTKALLPCPFCNDPMRYRHGVLAHVTPGDCPIGIYAWGAEDAVAAWNRRASPPSILEEAAIIERCAAVAEGLFPRTTKGRKVPYKTQGIVHAAGNRIAIAIRALAAAQPKPGPYGWLIVPDGLAEDDWRLSNDPEPEGSECKSFALYLSPADAAEVEKLIDAAAIRPLREGVNG